MNNYHIGQDGFVWFTGVVEDRDDPEKLGRVRVRAVGYHTDNLDEIPTKDLPWSWVLNTVHTSMNGLGHTPPFLVEGTWVVGAQGSQSLNLLISTLTKLRLRILMVIIKSIISI